MTEILHIRPAQTEDARIIAELLAAFGNDIDGDAVKRRIFTTYDKIMLVAMLNDRPVGVIEARVSDMLHLKNKLARITTLIVDHASRRKGVGRALVGAVENWAADIECSGIELTASLKASDAHGFYEALGFNISALRFTRCWAP